MVTYGKNVLKPRDFLCKIDLKDAYLCIPIHPLHRKYPGFGTVGGKSCSTEASHSVWRRVPDCSPNAQTCWGDTCYSFAQHDRVKSNTRRSRKRLPFNPTCATQPELADKLEKVNFEPNLEIRFSWIRNRFPQNNSMIATGKN